MKLIVYQRLLHPNEQLFKLLLSYSLYLIWLLLVYHLFFVNKKRFFYKLNKRNDNNQTTLHLRSGTALFYLILIHPKIFQLSITFYDETSLTTKNLLKNVLRRFFTMFYI